MAPLPKKKQSRSRSNIRKNSPSRRRSMMNLSRCPSCGNLKTPHQICRKCGYYHQNKK